MSTGLRNIKWESVAFEGFPVADVSEKLDGFVSLEECTDYGIETSAKNPKKRNKLKKTKENSSESVPNKKLKLSNGFTVETCQSIKPSLTCDDSQCPNTFGKENVKNESKTKRKVKLGESVTKNGESKLSTEDMLAWSEFQIPEEILQGLAEQGFTKPTRIQQLTLPSAMLGRRDILGAAETGSGKTLAFGIPIIAGIMKLKEKQEADSERKIYSLILTPTRELAIQISGHLIAAAKYTGVRVAVVVGGMAQVKQERVLSRAPEIVVATPGRLWELIQQGQPQLQQLDNIKFLAIDETDRMMERNHFEELHPLLERLNSDDTLKASRQNFVFSATLTLVHDLPTHMKGKKVTKRGKIINRKVEKMTPQQKCQRLIAMIGMTNPKVVDITTKLGTAETLTECRITCSFEQKDCYLFYILKTHPGRTIVFCNSIGCVKRLAELFGLLKCHPLPLHASMPQRQRLKNLERFRDDPYGVLVATDVAARGLDIPNVDHVIHYQVPRTAENYVHRSGRTARASKEGLTILMMEPAEAHTYTKLCHTLNKTSELSQFPVPAHALSTTQAAVAAARELDLLQLRQRRATHEQGWLAKAADEMDMLVDEDFVPIKNHKVNGISKILQIKKKELDSLLSKPIFPKGFSYKYPTLNTNCELLMKKPVENALQVMKNALASGSLKKEKRLGKNAPLLKLQDKLKLKNNK